MLPIGFLKAYEVISSGICILLGLFGMVTTAIFRYFSQSS